MHVITFKHCELSLSTSYSDTSNLHRLLLADNPYISVATEQVAGGSGPERRAGACRRVTQQEGDKVKLTGTKLLP